MINNARASSALSLKRRTGFYALAFAALVAAIACQSGGGTTNSEARGIIIVNAPAAGEVRRVLVREGMTINEGTPIVEIAVQTETPAAPTPSPGESAEARAVHNYESLDTQIESARAEAVQHDAEIQRLTPLVASGEASAAQLEGERALSERAQRRLQQLQDAKRKAEIGLLTTRQSNQNQASPTAPAPREQIVIASATAAGTVSAITAKVGDRVKAGQPLATLRADVR